MRTCAGADGRSFELAAGRMLSKLVRQLRKRRTFPPHDEARLRAARGTGAHLAGLTGVANEVRVLADHKTLLLQQRGYLALSLFRADGVDGMGEILCRKIIATAADEADADHIHPRVINVGAVGHRLQPLPFNGAGSGADRQVLSHRRKMGAGLGGAINQCRLAGILMRKVGLAAHQLVVLAGGNSKGRVPLEWAQSLVGARQVGQVEELFFLRGGHSGVVILCHDFVRQCED